VSTLTSTVLELKESGINTKFAILDAGYYSEPNIITLYKNKISFVTRLKENLKVCKELTKKYLPNIEDKSNFVSYNSRYVFIKCVECELVSGYKAYAYIGRDIDRKNLESRKLFERAKGQKLSNAEVYDKMNSHGTFILASSQKIAIDKILPTYYMRQNVEQIFDIGKNYANMLPLRVQNEDTFRGHLLMTFIATVVVRKLQENLKDSVYNPISIFMNLRNHKCKVYNERVVVQESVKKVNEIYKIFKISCPTDIKIPKCR
jgi:transposase